MKHRNVLKIIYQAVTNNFLQATVWMFIGTGILSFGNYLYHLVMGRLLGPIEYGVLESIISFSYLLSVPLMTLNLIIVKYVSEHKGKKDYNSISALYSFLNKRFFREGIILCFILIILSPLITKFLHLSSAVYGILLVLFVFTGFFSNLGKGMLQGLSNFSGLAAVNTVESISKIAIAVLLVFIGLRSQGGLIGIVASSVLAYISASLFLSVVRSGK